MDKELLIQNIEKAALRIGKKPTPICIEAGVGRQFMSDLRRGKIPSVAKVADLALHLGVSVSDLIGDARQPEEAPELLACWAELNEEGREALLHVAQGFVYSGIYKNGDPDAVDQDA